ncbi:hypothetical protein [Amycolatopsis sp. NPDC006125]|uniref:hypothetical protein n=1 Tax=Amycolatopsis sp. NPDC006125 TaxID=3156730 RepID=UPI0033B704D9
MPDLNPGQRVRIGVTYGTVIPHHDTVRVRLDTGHEANFATRVVVPIDSPEPGKEWAVQHPDFTLVPQSESAARFTQAQIPGSVLVHWDGEQWQAVTP